MLLHRRNPQVVAYQRQQLPQVGYGGAHGLCPLAQLGVVRARLLLGEEHAWRAANVSASRLHPRCADAQVQQAHDGLKSGFLCTQARTHVAKGVGERTRQWAPSYLVTDGEPREP